MKLLKMKKLTAVTLAMTMSLGMAVPAMAEVVELPLEAGPGLEYDWNNYISATEYEDPSLSVKV